MKKKMSLIGDHTTNVHTYIGKVMRISQDIEDIDHVV